MGVNQILSPDLLLTSKRIHMAAFPGVSLRHSIVMLGIC